MRETAPVTFRSARLSILAAYLGHAVGILLGGLGVTFITQLLPEDWQWIGPLLIALIVAAMVVEPLWSYAFTRYIVTADAIVEESGWLDRRVKTLRWSRVQALDRSTEWQLRVFGLADLTIAQSGQEASQIVVRGVSAARIEQVLALASAARTSAALPGDTADEAAVEGDADAAPGARRTVGADLLYRASVWDLVLMSVMFGAAVLAVPLLAFGAWEAVEQFGMQEWVSGVIASLNPVGAAAIAAVAVIGGGIVKTVLTYHGFEVRREGAELRIRHGLLITHERRFKEASIQGVVLQRNLLEQCTGRARLWLLTQDANEHLGKNLVLPSLPTRVVERIAREAFPSRVPAHGDLLARRPPVATTFVTVVIAAAVVAGSYWALTTKLEWPPLPAGTVAVVALAIVSALCRVLLARLESDPGAELLLLHRTYLTESKRYVDLAVVHRITARRLPAWIAPGGQRLLPSASIYAGKALTLRALRGDAATVERARTVSVAHAPKVAAAIVAQHRG